MNYEEWRISYQSSEQAAREAFAECEKLRAEIAAIRHSKASDGQWAVGMWNSQVKFSPLKNIHRRTLDIVWRSVIKRLGLDDLKLCGPTHDEIIAANYANTLLEHFGKIQEISHVGVVMPNGIILNMRQSHGLVNEASGERYAFIADRLLEERSSQAQNGGEK